MMWKDKYKIGVENIDVQHQELFRRVSDFIQAVQGTGEWEDKLVKVKETLAFMKDYVVFHFNDEEAYLEEINFPDYYKHREIHEKFKDEVNSYGEKFAQEDYSRELVQEFGGKLMAWLINHVAVSDQKIGDYMKGGGEKRES